MLCCVLCCVVSLLRADLLAHQRAKRTTASLPDVRLLFAQRKLSLPASQPASQLSSESWLERFEHFTFLLACTTSIELSQLARAKARAQVSTRARSELHRARTTFSPGRTPDWSWPARRRKPRAHLLRTSNEAQQVLDCGRLRRPGGATGRAQHLLLFGRRRLHALSSVEERLLRPA